MHAAIATERIARSLRRTRSRHVPEPPIALVTGPRVELSTGDPDRPFYTASIDKVLVATLIAQLFDAGRCALDTPIGHVLPAHDIARTPAARGVDAAHDVTVRHLLSHTAGLPDVFVPPRGHVTTCSIDTLLADPARSWSIPELLQQAQHLPAVGRPGERFHYGDTGYLLLMRIIEEAHDGSFGEQLRARVLEPAGMTDTVAWVGADTARLDALAPSLAPCWLDGHGRVPRAFLPNLTWQHGLGGPSTANDLVRFQRALHAGRLCGPAWVGLLGAPQGRLRPGIHYGSGMVALRFGGFSPFLRGLPEPIGGLGSTATHMFYYPEQQTHVVLAYHAPRRMQASVRMHIRIASLIGRLD